MKKVLVTGGAGFIGSAVIEELQRSDHEVFVIDNLSFGHREFVNIDDSHFFVTDILSRDEIFQLVSKIQPHWVIHLAAIHFIPYCNQHPFKAADINIRGSINVWDALEQVDSLEKAFFASTAAVYPISDDAVSETHPLGPMDIYGVSKLAGERLANEFHLKTKVPVVTCRFFNAFGPNETNPHLIPEIQSQVNSGKRIIELGNLDPKRDFIHTYDMARAVRLLMEKEMSAYEIFNLGRGIEYSVREVVQSFERQIGEKVEIKVDQKRVRKVERMHLLADISKLIEAVNWKPEWSLDDGVKTLVGTEANV